MTYQWEPQKFDDKDVINLMEIYKVVQSPIGIEIVLGNKTIFQFLSPELSIDKQNWLRRKRNTVLHFELSTLEVSKKVKNNEAVLKSKYGLDLKDYTTTPGGVPITYSGVGVIGALTVTGLTPDEDHDLAMTFLKALKSRRVE